MKFYSKVSEIPNNHKYTNSYKYIYFSPVMHTVNFRCYDNGLNGFPYIISKFTVQRFLCCARADAITEDPIL